MDMRDPKQISGYLCRIAQGLSMIAERLSEYGPNILSLEEMFRRIDTQLNYLIEEVAKDENCSRARKIHDDMFILQQALCAMSDVTFAVFERSREIDVKALWLELILFSKGRARIGILEQTYIIEDYVEALVATAMGLVVNPRFVRLRTEMKLLANHYGLSLYDIIRATDPRFQESCEIDAVEGAEREASANPAQIAIVPSAPSTTAETADLSSNGARIELPKQWPKNDTFLAVDITENQTARFRRGGPGGFLLAAARETGQRALYSANFPKFDLHEWERMGEPGPLGTRLPAHQESESVPVFEFLHAQSEEASNFAVVTREADRHNPIVSVGSVIKEDIDVVLWSGKSSTCPLIMRKTPTETTSIRILHTGPRLRTKWWHLRRCELSFAEFKVVAQDGAADNPRQKAATLTALTEVHRRNEKEGGNDQFVRPMFVQNIINKSSKATSNTDREAKISFVSLPYVRCRKGEGSSLAQSALMHEGEDREGLMTQCGLGKGSKELSTAPSLETTNIWLLIVGESFMLTCGDMSLEDLRTGIMAEEPTTSRPPREIEVRSYNDRAWLVPVAEPSEREAPTVWLAAAFGERMTDVA